MAKFKKHQELRKFFKECPAFCKSCDLNTGHELYFGMNKVLYSKCLKCVRTTTSSHPVNAVLGERVTQCVDCTAKTLHLHYEAADGRSYWMCSSCGAETTATQ